MIKRLAMFLCLFEVMSLCASTATVHAAPLAGPSGSGAQGSDGGGPPTFTYGFRELSALDCGTTAHTFSLLDNSGAPIKLQSLQPSCGCTTVAALSDGKYAMFPLTLRPGQTLQVNMSIDLRSLLPGPVDKFVYVMVSGRTTPYAVFEMKGTLLPPVVVSQEALDFGPVPVGSSKSLILTASFNPELLASPHAPALTAAGPDLTVQQLYGQDALDARAQVGFAPLQHAAGPIVTRTYKITFSPKAPAAELQSDLVWSAAEPGLPPIADTIPVHGKIESALGNYSGK